MISRLSFDKAQQELSILTGLKPQDEINDYARNLKILKENFTALQVAVSFIYGDIDVLTINWGAHTPGSLHYTGRAIDFSFFKNNNKCVFLSDFYYIAFNCGFKGAGVYKNSRGFYSYHVDLGPRIMLWTATPLRIGTAGDTLEWSYRYFKGI